MANTSTSARRRRSASPTRRKAESGVARLVVSPAEEAAAMAEARWEACDLLSRRPEMAADLLRGHAAELAFSAERADQALSLALDRAAADLDAGRPPLGGCPEPEPAPRTKAVRLQTWRLTVFAMAAGLAAAVAAGAAMADF